MYMYMYCLGLISVHWGIEFQPWCKETHGDTADNTHMISQFTVRWPDRAHAGFSKVFMLCYAA